MHELEAYQNMLIPVCLGLYKIKTALPFANGADATCLITLHTGNPVVFSFSCNKYDDRYNMVNLVYGLHAVGFSHNDLRESNFRLTETSAMLIDLETVTRHECNLLDIEIGGPLPWIKEFECGELWSFCANLGIWDWTHLAPIPSCYQSHDESEVEEGTRTHWELAKGQGSQARLDSGSLVACV